MRAAEKEERPGQIKCVDKCGGQLAMAVGSMMDPMEVAAGTVSGAEDFKIPVVRSGGKMPPSHASRMEIYCRAPRRGRDATDAIKSVTGMNNAPPK